MSDSLPVLHSGHPAPSVTPLASFTDASLSCSYSFDPSNSFLNRIEHNIQENKLVLSDLKKNYANLRVGEKNAKKQSDSKSRVLGVNKSHC